jgi:uncharacterized RDD family membrane protein YckC
MSAERKLHSLDEATLETGGDDTASLEPFVLRQQVAERLAAHRARRNGASAAAAPRTAPASPRSRIAAAVAERYAQSKTYRDFLAEEAERAVREAEEAARQAEAAAEIAQRNAEAVAQVQYDLLAELDGYTSAPPPVDEATVHSHTPVISTEGPQGRSGETRFSARVAQSAHEHDQPALNLTPAFTPADLTVRLAEDIRPRTPDPAAHRSRRTAVAHQPIEEAITTSPSDPEEALSLDDEIAFRQAPVFEPVEPPVEIPANLIEFPRQLVAARRARPRIAEGPLRDEAEQHHDPSQLRIFEVETEQISAAPASDSAAPEWSSMILDAHPRQAAHYNPAANYEAPAAYTSSYDLSSTYVSASTYPGYADESGYAGDLHEPARIIAHHLQPSPETQHLYATPLKVAPLELRLMSAAVDLIAVIAGFVVCIAAFALIISRFSPEGLHMSLQTAALSSAGTIVLLGLLYQWVFFTFSDATPGMRYARIGLCTFSDDNPTREAMRRRILALILSTAPFGLGLLWTLLDEDRMGWHDRISRMYQRSY